MLHEQRPELTRGVEPEHGPSRFVRVSHQAEQLQLLGTRRLCQKGEVLLRSGDVPDCCYFVLTGQVVAVKETEGGSELILCIMEENSLLAEANMLFHRALPVTFRATMPTEVYRIPESVLRSAIATDTTMAMTVMECIADKFFAEAAENEKIKSHNAAWLLCDLLISMAERYGVAYDDKVLIRKKLTIDSMTSMLGVNRATTVRAIRSLKDVGLLENINGFYCVRSIEQLRRHQELRAVV